MCGYGLKYRVVQNPFYALLMKYTMETLFSMVSLKSTREFLEQNCSDNSYGDMFECLGSYLFWQNEPTALLELGSTMWWMDAVWTMGFEQACEL